MNSVVVGEFSEREPVTPIGLSVVHKDPEVLLDLLVNPFCLAVCLGVEGGGCIGCDIEHPVEFLHELGHELGSSIRNYGGGHTMSHIYMISKDSGPSFG